MSRRGLSKLFCVRLREERGFTIIELMAAILILAFSLVALAATAESTFSYAAKARQKQDSTAIANQAIEQVRALAVTHLTDGMMTSDLTGDSAITTCGLNKCYNGEVIIQSASPSASPLNPHVVSDASMKVGPTQFTRKSYLTSCTTNPCSSTTTGVVRVTVVVSWRSQTGGTSSRILESVIPTSTECPAGDLHPFSGPCQTAFSASSIDGGARIEIAPYDTAGTGFTGFSTTDLVSMAGPKVASDLGLEQTATATGSITTSGFNVSGSTSASCGNVGSASAADNDQSGTDTTYSYGPTAAATDTTCASSASTPPQIKVPAIPAAGNNFLTLQKLARDLPDLGATVSTIAASGSDTYSCNSQSDGFPCSYSKTKLNGKLVAWLSDPTTGALGYGSAALGTCPLVQMNEPATYASTYINRDVATGSSDKVTVSTTRYMPTVFLGCLPVNLAPNGSTRATWDSQTSIATVADRRTDPAGNLRGFWLQIKGWTTTLTTEAGVGASAVSTTRGATVYWWNGNGYSTQTITSSAATVPSSGSLQSVTSGCVAIGSGKAQFTMTPVDATNASQTSFSVPVTDTITQGSAPITYEKATASDVSFPNLRIQLSSANANCNAALVDLRITLNFGTAYSEASYSVPAS